MTTTFFLVRHGDNDLIGRAMAGRSSGVHLNAAGRRQAEAVAERLGRETIAAVYSSPLERTRETAEPIARRHGLEVQLCDALVELDFGAWTGMTLEQLHHEPLWEPWNSRRSLTRPPQGESMGEAQMRGAGAAEAIAARHPEQGVVLVSHGDVIKGLVCLWLGLDLDHFQRFEIDPCSISIALLGDWGVKLLRINEGV